MGFLFAVSVSLGGGQDPLRRHNLFPFRVLTGESSSDGRIGYALAALSIKPFVARFCFGILLDYALRLGLALVGLGSNRRLGGNPKRRQRVNQISCCVTMLTNRRTWPVPTALVKFASLQQKLQMGFFEAFKLW